VNDQFWFDGPGLTIKAVWPLAAKDIVCGEPSALPLTSKNVAVMVAAEADRLPMAMPVAKPFVLSKGKVIVDSDTWL
jgi:hypothetical protein